MQRTNRQNDRQDGLVISVHAPKAGAVFLAGTFNGWDPRAHPMRKTGAGDWVRTLNLPSGRYEYKFVIDGQWCCEPGCDRPYKGCPRCVSNPYGTMNRVLIVDAADAQRSEPSLPPQLA